MASLARTADTQPEPIFSLIARAARSWLERRANGAPASPAGLDLDGDGGFAPSARLWKRPLLGPEGESPEWPAAPALAAYTGSVYGCASAIARRVARAAVGATLNLERADGSVERIPRHVSLDAIRRGNDFLTAIQVFELISLHRSLAGDAYAVKLRGPANRIVGLWPIAPSKVRKVVSDSGGQFILGVNVYPEGAGHGEKYFFARRDLVMSMALAPTDSVYGWSRLRAAAYEKNASDARKVWEAEWVANECRPDYVIGAKIPPGTDADGIMRRILARVKRHGRRKGEPLVLPSELTLDTLQHSMRDMQWIEAQGLRDAEIRSIFGVNRYVVSDFDDVGDRAQAGVAMDQFAEATLLPELEDIFAALDRDILEAEEYVPRSSGARLYFDFPDVVTGDKEREHRELLEDFQAGVITLDEHRAAKGRAPYEPGDTPGSVIWLPFGRVPLDGALLDDALGLLGPGETATSEEDRARPLVDRAILAALRRIAPPADAATRAEVIAEPPPAPRERPILTRAALEYRDRDLQGSEAARTAYWRREMIDRLRDERRMERVLRAALDQQGRRVIEAWEKRGDRAEALVHGWSRVRVLRLGRGDEIRALIDDLGIWDAGQEDEALARVLRAASRRTYANRGKRASALLGLDFQVDTPRAVRWLERHAVQTTAYLNDTTRRRIGKVIADGLADGRSIAEIARDLRDDFKRMNPVRSFATARTETAAAAGRGALEAWTTGDAAAIVDGHTWVTSRDAEVREDDGEGNPPGHRIDGETVGLGERFSNGMRYEGDEEAPPGLRVNERCTTAPRVRTED